MATDGETSQNASLTDLPLEYSASAVPGLKIRKN